MQNIYLSLIFDGNVAMIMAAVKSETGVITPLATESHEVRTNDNLNGITSVTSDNKMAVTTLIRKIINKIKGNYEVTGIYLGIMPRSMHGEALEARRDFEGKHRITEHDIQNLENEIVKMINNTVVAQYSNGFIRDGQETFNVRNELADYIVRKSLAVVVSPRHQPDYNALFPGNVTLHKVIPTQVAIARLVADEEQRVNGVMSFHIGNQSSGLTFIHNDQIMGTAVVPFGFDHIIHDMSLNKIPEDKVRSFVTSSKMRYKWAPEATIRFSNDGPSFGLYDAMEAFNARVREIFSLAYDRILASINEVELKYPVIVSSSLINTPEYASALSDLLEQDCILGNAKNVLNDDQFENPKFIPLIALINEANRPCVEEKSVVIEIEEPQPEEVKEDEKKEKKKKKKFWDAFKEQSLFNDEQ